eukprot:9105650-Alexandrium_andersonii.AAC.1
MLPGPDMASPSYTRHVWGRSSKSHPSVHALCACFGSPVLPDPGRASPSYSQHAWGCLAKGPENERGLRTRESIQ